MMHARLEAIRVISRRSQVTRYRTFVSPMSSTVIRASIVGGPSPRPTTGNRATQTTMSCRLMMQR